MTEKDSKPTKRKLRWYQFNLRTLLIVVTLLSLLFSWVGVRMQQARENRKAAAEVFRAMDEIISLFGAYYVSGGGSSLENLFDDPGVAYIYGIKFDPHGTGHASELTDTDLQELISFLKEPAKLRVLGLDITQVTDEGLEHLKKMTGLEELTLSGTQVTGAGLVYLKGLTSLRYLCVENTRITMLDWYT